MTQLIYVRWLDACYQPGEHTIADLGKGVVLEHYGVLIKLTRTGVVLSTEVPLDNSGEARNPFTIPRKNILEMRVVDAAAAFQTSNEIKKSERKASRAMRLLQPAQPNVEIPVQDVRRPDGP